jgi:hypothetical protein
MTDPPDSLYYEDTVEKEKELTMQSVVDWVDKWDRHNGRLRFFADLTPTAYYQFVAKPLLSLKATGYISVERTAKPLKNRVASKDRNRLATSERELLLRVGMNLRLKMASLRSVKAALGQAVDSNDGLVYE